MFYLSDNWETFTHNGRDYAAKLERDDTHGAPWDEECGHGPVTGWESRDKLPGELILTEDRGAKRFYDFQEACRIARRDEWGFLPYKLEIKADNPSRAPYTACGGWAVAGPFKAYHPENFNRAIREVYAAHRASMTPREYAAKAARADYERLRQWCNDIWHYVGVIVAPICPKYGEVIERESVSLWGIESDAGEYLEEAARELADEIDYTCEQAA